MILLVGAVTRLRVTALYWGFALGRGFIAGILQRATTQ